MAILIDILAAGAVDASGAVLDSGVAYVYQVGTTTKQDVFQDNDLTVPHSNPITLDAAGRAEAYVNTPVRIIIEDSSGTQIDDIESVGAVQALTGDITIGTNSSNFLQINSRIKSDLDPFAPDVYTVGDASNIWKEGHFNDVFVYDDLTVTSDVSIGNDLSVTGEVTISGTGVHSVPEAFANEVWEEYARSNGTAPGTRGVAISASSGSYSNNTTSYTDVTSDITLVTNGRPVFLAFIHDDGATQGRIRISKSGGASVSSISGALIFLLDGATEISFQQITMSFPADTSTSHDLQIPLSSLNHIHPISAGTYTFRVQGKVFSTDSLIEVISAKLVVYEL